MKKITMIEVLIVIVVIIVIVNIWGYYKNANLLSNKVKPLKPYIFLTEWGEKGDREGQFENPLKIAIDKNNNIYVVDRDNCRIQKFDSDGNFITTWGSKGRTKKNGPELAGLFLLPIGICSDGSNNIYVVDRGNSRIQKFDSDGNFKAAWEDIASFAISADEKNNIYVDDLLAIQKFDADGNFINKWPLKLKESGAERGVCDIRLDSSGYIYILLYANTSDFAAECIDDIKTHNSYIFKYDSSGNFISSWGVYGSEFNEYKDYINSARGIGIDKNDHIFVAETGENRIQVYDPNGVFITEWGTKGTGDGEFRGPVDVAVDSEDNVYVVDYENCRIQKFAPNPDYKKTNDIEGGKNEN
ncbi:MAG: hypothetical protein KKA19_04285 [Candidatus Margulisbacteria bacterium]|nr:hypothetical protein [Candidatus Margulisiibacteriota bacterium]